MTIGSIGLLFWANAPEMMLAATMADDAKVKPFIVRRILKG